MGHYVLDFFCDDARLVVEVDGPVHLSAEQLERDQARQLALESLGLTVLRFTNQEVIFDLDATLARIQVHLQHNSFER